MSQFAIGRKTVSAALAVLAFVLVATVSTADQIILKDGRVITNVDVKTEADIDQAPHARWREKIADPSWIVMETANGWWAIRDTGQIERIEFDGEESGRPPETSPGVAEATGAIVSTGPGAGPGVTTAPGEDGLTEINLNMAIQLIRGRVYVPSAGKRQLLATGDTAKGGDELRVTWNSRMRGVVAEIITLGVMEGTTFRINRLWKHVRIGTEYNIDLSLTQGKIWLDVSSRLSTIDRVRFTINGNQLLTTKPILMNISMNTQNVLEAAVFDSKDVNIRFILPGVEQAVPLALGKRVEVSEIRATLGSDLDDVPLDPQERAEWDTWADWRPVELRSSPVVARPDVSGMRPHGFIAALPVDDPGRNTRAIRSVRYQSTFYALRSYRAGLRSYFKDIGEYPPENESWSDALKVNPGAPAWRGPYVDADLPATDVWGRPFRYEKWHDVAGTLRTDIRSTGPNGIDEFGFGDDLR